MNTGRERVFCGYHGTHYKQNAAIKNLELLSFLICHTAQAVTGKS